ncbi:MAG TPA: ABC transporter ATP-binding protein, partial [Lacipirellulaceae bacterium]|nr:ABC transporter ATP-binding protein [Lacipirellulaceae bacterium]
DEGGRPARRLLDEMTNFARALKEAWRHWPALAAALCCSLGVAVLWGANIAALFPIIETTLHGKSLQAWNAQRLVDSQERLAEHLGEAAALEAQLAGMPAGDARRPLELQLDMVQTRVRVDRAAIYSAERLQPLVERFLPADPFSTVVLIVSLVVAATALKHVCSLTNIMLVAHVSQSIARDVRSRIFDKSLGLDRPGFNSLGISGFTAHITHTTDMLASGLTSFYGGAITEPLRIFSCLCGAWYISWRLTLASMIFAPLAAYLMLHLNRKIRGLSRRILDRSLGFHHVMLEVFNGLVTVQAFTMEEFEKKRFRDSTAAIKKIAVKATFYNSLSSPVTEVLGMGMLCTGLTVSSYLVLNQQTHLFGIRMSDQPLSIPAVTVFFGMLIGAADPLRKLSGVITGVNTGMAAANLLYPILDMQSRLTEPADPKSLPLPHKQLEFRDVTFSYDGAHNVLSGVNLTVHAGEHVAIVGPNGGGKSTMVNLLCRFYDPQQGDVLIDGVSLRDVPLNELRRRIALVSQQTELFNESIMHNIRYGRWDATDAEVMAAAELARAHDFIQTFPEGYNTLVGPNGQRLSGGQRQRVALARAFLRNAEILIMDEATSQIDVDSERLIHDALVDFGRNRTLIMITHRESTLTLADKIVRMEYGALEEVGAPAVKAA